MNSKFIPLGIFCLSIFVTLVLWNTVHHLEVQKDQLEFDSNTDKIQGLIEDKLDQYRALISGAKGFFVASQLVEPAEWSKFVSAQNIQEKFSGIQGLGFIKHIKNEDIASFFQFMNRYGVADYQIWPEGKRDEYYPIMYLEPHNMRNERAIGYDLYSEPTRRQAIDIAVATGNNTITGKITLVLETDDDIQFGFLMMQPVYENEKSLQTEIDRKDNIVGFVYAPFRINDLMNATLNPSLVEFINLKIYDGNEEPQNLLFVKDSISQNQGNTPRTKTTMLSFGQKTWTLVFHDIKPNTLSNTLFSNVILVVGVTMSILISLISHFINKNNVLLQEQVKLERFSTIGKIGANIAHDLRNPLAVIKGSFIILKMEKNMNKTFEEKQYEKIDNSIKKIEYLTKDILDFANIQELKTEEIGFLEIIKESIHEIKIPNQIEIKLPEHDFRIIADKIKLQSAISNLIKNSIEAIGEKGSIAIDLEENYDNVVFTIKDTGKGLSSDELPKIFEPLYTTKMTGTGLGLAICKRIIEHHKGKITVKTNPTTFIVSLPKNRFSKKSYFLG